MRPRVISCARAALLGALACSTTLTGAGGASRDARSSGAALAPPGWASSLPKSAERHYRVSAKIRPLYLFWVGPDNLGIARMAWYRGQGDDRGYEVLLGSDPERAPRWVNRWGYVAEEHRGGEVLVSGVMKQSNETTLEEATARAEEDRREGSVFEVIHERIRGGESVSEVTTARVSRDYSYRDLDRVVGEIERAGRTPEVRRMRIEPGVRPGMLSTLTAIVHEDAESWRRAPAARGASGKVVRYAYNAKTYLLTLSSSRFVGVGEYGGRTYARLVQDDFELTRPGVRWKEHFSLVYSLDGPDAELPVYVSYQPRWWFKAELFLDEAQRF